MISKCLVVTVNLAGLGEVVKGKGIMCQPPIDANLNELHEKMCFVLKNTKLKEHYIKKAYEWALNQDFESLYDEWVHEVLV